MPSFRFIIEIEVEIIKVIIHTRKIRLLGSLKFKTIALRVEYLINKVV